MRSDADCRRLIATLKKPVRRRCFTLIYAYGLRITEAVTLPVAAVDSKQRVLCVIGKRNKQRILPLTDSILHMLREVWKTHRSPKWLFPSRRLVTHLTEPLRNQLRQVLAQTSDGLLMQVAAEAVKELCANRRHLGARPGILSVLHTWNGRVGYHPHVHMLIIGGGITPDGRHWNPARGEFLVPIAILSRKIAGKFRQALEGKAPDVLAHVPPDVWRREWVSFVKHYGHGNEAVLNYLSRYVFRTAITNARILAMDHTYITFRFKDRHADTWGTERLPGVEFLRRFLQHVLPRGFHKVRYYGLWHPSKRAESNRAWVLLILQTPDQTSSPPKLADLLAPSDQLPQRPDAASLDLPEDDTRRPRCPCCGSRRTRLLGEYPRCGGP